jgi:hypothetical protein
MLLHKLEIFLLTLFLYQKKSPLNTCHPPSTPNPKLSDRYTGECIRSLHFGFSGCDQNQFPREHPPKSNVIINEKI